MRSSELPILYQDEHYVVINKPHNLLVHRSSIAADESVFALQLLRDQLGKRVNPCHRIDRKTAGVLIFALSSEADSAMQKMFEAQAIEKHYLALVRGFVPIEGMTDRPLENEKGKLKESLTYFKCLEQIELDFEVNRYPTSRYSLVEVIPKTGRTHQIRRHFAQMRHYLIGDKTHGDCKQNKAFEERFGLDTMLLHAHSVKFTHPFNQQIIEITAPLSETFNRILDEIGMEYHKPISLPKSQFLSIP